MSTGGGGIRSETDFNISFDGMKSFKFIKKIRMTAKSKIYGIINVEVYKNVKNVKTKQW
jgi:hypothetical protein